MKKKNPNPYFENILWIIFVIIAGFATEVYCMVAGRDIGLGELARNFFSYIKIGRLVFFEVVYLGSLATVYITNRKGFKLLDFIYNKRYWIALVALIICTIFQISGSSIGCWEKVLGYNTDRGILAGTSRSIRSDEWAVFTPMALGQTANGFKYMNNNLRGGYPTDMFIIYGQPVKDISMIFRITQIGYLLFGAGRGLAFYWCFRFIALFMASFEFLMLITKKNKRLSLVGSIVIVLSPTIQWWYSTNCLIEMIVSAEVGLVLFDKYFKEENFKLRILYMAIIFVCLGTYALTFYPAWMVPVAYIFLPFLIWIIIENRKNIKLTKGDIISFVVIALVFAGLMGRILSKSWDTIVTTLNTAYPGKRVLLEKGSPVVYVGFIVNSLLTIVTSFDNPCDMSVMMDFWPIALILLAIYIFKEKKKDILITLSLIFVLILNAYYLFSAPEWLAKISLLSRSWYGRIYQVFGLLNIFILFRILSTTEFKFKKLWAIIVSALVSGICVLGAKYYYSAKISLIMVGVLFAVFTLIFFSILRYTENRKMFTWVIVIFMIVIGGLVNPVRAGINLVSEDPLLKAIEKINSEEEGLWSLIEIGLPEINLPNVVNAKTLNSTSVYPNLELWKKIDKENKYEDIYNRYAHIFITLVPNEEETEFELLAPDVIRIFIRYDDLKTLGVNYIVRGAKLPKMEKTDQIQLEEKYKDNNYIIYKVNY